MQQLGLPIRLMGPAEFRAYWAAEAALAPLVQRALATEAGK